MKSENEELYLFSLFLSKLILFGLNNQLVVTYKEENLMAFKTLFLKSYSGVEEDDYSVAVYTKQSVFDHLYYIIDQVCLFFSPHSQVTHFQLLLLLFHLCVICYTKLGFWTFTFLVRCPFPLNCSSLLHSSYQLHSEMAKMANIVLVHLGD